MIEQMPDGMLEKAESGNLKSGNPEDCVPLAALAMPDGEQGDQMANPEVGDKVSYTIEGAVTRIDGDQAYVKRESVNGQPLAGKAEGEKAESGNESEMPPDPEGAALRGEASQMQSL